jgi:uncharacterized protein (DUF58 family)
MVGRLFASLTAVGRFVTGSAFGCYVGGVLLGWQELLMLSFGCFAALAIGMAWVARSVPLKVKRTLHPDRVTVGGSAFGVIEVANSTRRSVGSRIADDQIGDRAVRIEIPSLAAGAQHEMTYTVHGRNRGLLQVGPVTLSRTDPLRLFRVVQSQGSVEQLWVQPRVHKMRSAATGWTNSVDGPTSDVSPRGSAAFHALREYQLGDDMRHVHWVTSARVNKLMVRHFVDTQFTRELIVLDPRSSLYTDDSFEDAVEIAASIAHAAKLTNRETLLVLPGQDLIDERLEPLDQLTLVRRQESMTDEQLFQGRSTSREAGGANGMVVVTGDVNVDKLVATAKTVMRGKTVIVVRCRPKLKEAAMSRISGSAIFDTPSAAGLVALWSEAVKRP